MPSPSGPTSAIASASPPTGLLICRTSFDSAPLRSWGDCHRFLRILLGSAFAGAVDGIASRYFNDFERTRAAVYGAGLGDGRYPVLPHFRCTSYKRESDSLFLLVYA